MIWMGEIVAGETVPVRAQFHDDTGTAADPATPFARLETGSGTFVDLATPTKRDAKTGYFGVDVDTTGFTAGVRTIRIGGTVATAKVVAAVYGFMVVAHRSEEVPKTPLLAASYTAPPSVGDIATAVWAASTRTLSSFGTLAADMWAHATRTLTDVSDSSGITTLLSRLTDLRTSYLDYLDIGDYVASRNNVYDKTDSLSAEHNILSGQITARPTNPLLTTDLRLDNLDALISSRSTLTAQQVWEYVTRELTSAGAGGATAQEVWEYATRALTDKSGFSGEATNMRGTDNAMLAASYVAPDNTAVLTAINSLDFSTLTAQQVWEYVERTLTNAGSTLTAQEVWEYATRALTDKSGFSGEATNMRGTDNAMLAANYTPPDDTMILTAIADLDFSKLTAQEVWEYVTRTLTSNGSTLTAQEVWEYATRALTDKSGFSGEATNMRGTDNALLALHYADPDDTAVLAAIDALDFSTLTAQQVWEYMERTLTSAGSTLTAQEVWEYATRALTDKSGFSGEATNMVAEAPSASSIASAVWSAATRTLSSISDSTGVTSLLSRLSELRAAKLDRDIAEKADVVLNVTQEVVEVTQQTVEVTTQEVVVNENVDYEELADALASRLPTPLIVSPQPVLVNIGRQVNGRVLLGKDDTLDSVEATILTKAPVDLTGWTATFSMRNRDTGELVLDAVSASIDVAKNTVRYEWDAPNTSASGRYLGRFRLTSTQGTFSVPNKYGIEIDISGL